jgi:CheY-like chemotaxis protein
MKRNLKSRVVIVDDDPDYVYLLKQAIEVCAPSCELYGLHSGSELLQWLTTHERPSVILLDINMPVTNGFEILQTLKASPHYRTIPVLMLTVSGYQADVVKAYQIGANAYTTKPVGYDELISKMRLLSTYWFTVVSTPDQISA